MQPDDKVLQRAKTNAYILLRSRPRSEAEMRGRLKLKGYGPDIIEAVVAALQKSGHLDDAKFARLWVESRMQSNPMGDMALRRELKEKGIRDAIIEATLADKASRYDEYRVAFTMASERFKRLVKLDRRKALKRLYDHLMRRGFSYEIVQRIVDAMINEDR